MSKRAVTIKLGARKRVALQRRVDLVQSLGFWVSIIPVLLVVAQGDLRFNDLGNLLSSTNRLLAIFGTALLLLHLALVARIPWIEKVIGLDKLTSSHKKLGKPLVVILGLHLAVSVVSYSIRGQIPIFEALWELNLGYFAIALATLGYALMLLITFSSIRAARARLSYETWFLIHLLSYLAVGVSIPHQLELGTDFLGQPLVVSFFTLLYAFVFGNLLVFRVLVPVALSLQTDLKISKLERLNPRTLYVEVSGRGISRFDFQAGQFFMLRILTPRQWWRPHPFSLSHHDGQSVGFTIGIRGDDTSWISGNSVGTRVILEGPYGVFTELKRSRQHVALMGSGIGITPILSLANSLAAQPGDVSILYRVSDLGDAPLVPDLEAVSQRFGHRLKIDAGPRGQSGVLSAADTEVGNDASRLMQIFPNLHESDIYICGPRAWSDRLVETLETLGVDKNQIHIEEFAW
jgi:predicted ferric reductase